jgi:hypothetical protein
MCLPRALNKAHAFLAGRAAQQGQPRQGSCACNSSQPSEATGSKRSAAAKGSTAKRQKKAASKAAPVGVDDIAEVADVADGSADQDDSQSQLPKDDSMIADDTSEIETPGTMHKFRVDQQEQEKDMLAEAQTEAAAVKARAKAAKARAAAAAVGPAVAGPSGSAAPAGEGSSLGPVSYKMVPAKVDRANTGEVINGHWLPDLVVKGRRKARAEPKTKFTALGFLEKPPDTVPEAEKDTGKMTRQQLDEVLSRAFNLGGES